MPYKSANGETSVEQMDVFNANQSKFDSGPEDDNLYHVFEIETTARTYTLYSVDPDQINLFVLYLNKMIEFKRPGTAFLGRPGGMRWPTGGIIGVG